MVLSIEGTSDATDATHHDPKETIVNSSTSTKSNEQTPKWFSTPKTAAGWYVRNTV